MKRTLVLGVLLLTLTACGGGTTQKATGKGAQPVAAASSLSPAVQECMDAVDQFMVATYGNGGQSDQGVIQIQINYGMDSPEYRAAQAIFTDTSVVNTVLQNGLRAGIARAESVALPICGG